MSKESVAAQKATGDDGRFGELPRSENDLDLTPAVSGGALDALMTEDEQIHFGDAAINELHRIYRDESGGARLRASARCSIIRTKRLALLVADRFPDATGVEIEDAYQGDTECFVNAVVMADGSRVEADDLDGIDELNDEAFDIYDNNAGWKAVAEENGDAWVVNIAQAMKIGSHDVERGYVIASRD